jgi:hypothetical protein
MQTGNLLEPLTFSGDGPVKTPILQQAHFALVRIALGKGVTIPSHQGGHAVFSWSLSACVLKCREIATFLFHMP